MRPWHLFSTGKASAVAALARRAAKPALVAFAALCFIQALWMIGAPGPGADDDRALAAADRRQVVHPMPQGHPPARGVLLAPIDDLAAQLEVAWNAQNWPQVLQLIDQIRLIDPNYDDILDKKYYAHVNYGYQLMTEGRCNESLSQFRAALEVRPGGEEATAGMDLLVLYCGTPPPGFTPSVTPLTSITPYVTPTPTFITPFPTGFPTVTPVPIILPEPIEYTVQPGDTLFSLAQRYSTTVQAIMQANGMMSFFLRVGEVIIIPASNALPAGPIVHIVQPGETLQSLAAKYNTTVFAIKVLNNLRFNRLFAYQAIFIPSAQTPGAIVHIVQPGETLFSIAQIYDTSVPLIMLANHFETYTIHVYQRVIIPPEDWTGFPPIQIWTGPSPSDHAPEPHPVPGPRPGVRKHLVQPGDTLYSIAVHYGTTVQAIREANGLIGDKILSGTYLIIP